MRRVTIKLRSAKVVNTNCKVDTKTVGRYSTSPTDIINDMDNLIHFNHISNMFHVMMGSRPVSSRYDAFSAMTVTSWIEVAVCFVTVEMISYPLRMIL